MKNAWMEGSLVLNFKRWIGSYFWSS